MSAIATEGRQRQRSAGLERVRRLRELREDWDRLAEGAGHPFATWEWVSSWWRHLGRERELYTFALRDEAGQVVAILPMYVGVTRPLRVARFIGYGDLSSPLCLPEDRPRTAAALKRVLGPGRGRCRLLVAENVPTEQGWRELLGARRLAEHPDPRIELAGLDWEQFLAAKSRGFRKRTRQQERRLQRDYELRYRLADDPGRIDDDISELFRLHDLRWGERTTGVFRGRRGRQQRSAIKAALERGWLRLWFLELDGRTVAADLAWRWQGSEWGMNCGRDPSLRKESVGAVLLAHAVREACADGVDTYRLLEGDAPYKLEYATEVATAETLLVGSGLTAGVGFLAAAALDLLPDPVRAKLLPMLA